MDPWEGRSACHFLLMAALLLVRVAQRRAPLWHASCSALNADFSAGLGVECAARVGAGAAAGTRHLSVSSVYVYQEARKEGRYITASKKINNEAFKRVCMCVLECDVIAASAHGVCVWIFDAREPVLRRDGEHSPALQDGEGKGGGEGGGFTRAGQTRVEAREPSEA